MGFPLLAATLRRLIKEGGDPDQHADLDAWEAQWIRDPLPELGGKTPAEGLVSRGAESAWLNSGRTALLAVPSVIIVEEDKVLINPAHLDAKRITATKMRRFVCDHRV